MTIPVQVLMVVLWSVISLPDASALQLDEVVLLTASSNPIDQRNVTDSFAPSTPAIFAIALFSDVDETTAVTGNYVSIDAIATPDYVIASTEVTLRAGEDRAEFELTRPTNDWPTGHYRFDLYIDDILYTSAPFEVSTRASTQPPATGAPGGILGQQAAASRTPPETIVGTWNCQMKYGGKNQASGTMTIDTSGRLSFNQAAYTWQLLPGNILRMHDQVAQYDYGYQLEQRTLKLSYADGSSFDCDRVRSAAPGISGGQPATGSEQAGANTWQLKGAYCSFSASGGYSSSNRIYFDGNGRWSTSSESYSSGNSGSYYGSNSGDAGQYQIFGRTIRYGTDNGQQGEAIISMQQSDGRITEITVDGTLYGPALCD